MRYRPPIIQPGLTAEMANDMRDRYLRLNPGAVVTIDSQPDNPKLKTVIVRIPLLPSSKIRDQNAGKFKAYNER